MLINTCTFRFQSPTNGCESSAYDLLLNVFILQDRDSHKRMTMTETCLRIGWWELAQEIKMLAKKTLRNNVNLCIHKFQHNQEQIRTMVFLWLPVGFPKNPPLRYCRPGSYRGRGYWTDLGDIPPSVMSRKVRARGYVGWFGTPKSSIDGLSMK